jgi:hypothetical protein
MDASQVSMQSALDDGSVYYLNGARFSIPSSLIVDTNAMGRGTMPEFKSLCVLLSIVVTMAAEQQVKEYVRLV